MPRAILALNAGSSSIKCALYELVPGPVFRLAARARLEGLGVHPVFQAHDAAGREIDRRQWDTPAPAFDALLEHVIAWADRHLGPDSLAAVGHRVVHGGDRHVLPERVTGAVLDALDALSPLAPLHQPHNLAPIRMIASRRPQLLQVACYDTAFHRPLPLVARRFALPRDWFDAGVRRYGFHGLSYEYIAGYLREHAPPLARGRVIVAHLGNGASLCAMHQGRSVETSMGFTPLDGLVMGTRCGNLDPGVVLHLVRQHGLAAESVEDVLYRHSGLLGVSGLSSDMRELLASEDAHAREAVDLFVYRIVREVGALASVLGGLDGLIFTAGIGEHAAAIRASVCRRLHWLGAELDPRANAAHAGCIAAAGSRLDLRVIATDEEAMIARHTRAILQADPAG